MEIQIGQPLSSQLNRGLTLFASPKLGPLTVQWDYESEIAPFYGMLGLNYEV
jgi:hypothetical protein